MPKTKSLIPLMKLLLDMLGFPPICLTGAGFVYKLCILFNHVLIIKLIVIVYNNDYRHQEEEGNKERYGQRRKLEECRVNLEV